MKKSLLLLLAAASFGTAQAQKMGDVFIYGGVSFNSTKIDVGNVKQDNIRTFQLSPGIGYQFDRNWGAGIQVRYDITKTGTNSTNEESGYTFAAGPFVRYTQPLSNMFFLYGQLNASYVRDVQNGPTNGPNDALEGNGMDIGITPAVGINLSRCVSVIGSFGRLGYTRVVYDLPGSSDNLTGQNLEATIGSQFGLTVQWNLGARRMRTRREPMSETRNMDRYRDDANDADDREEAPMRRRGRMDNRRRMDRDDN